MAPEYYQSPTILVAYYTMVSFYQRFLTSLLFAVVLMNTLGFLRDPENSLGFQTPVVEGVLYKWNYGCIGAVNGSGSLGQELYCFSFPGYGFFSFSLYVFEVQPIPRSIEVMRPLQ